MLQYFKLTMVILMSINLISTMSTNIVFFTEINGFQFNPGCSSESAFSLIKEVFIAFIKDRLYFLKYLHWKCQKRALSLALGWKLSLQAILISYPIICIDIIIINHASKDVKNAKITSYLEFNVHYVFKMGKN